MTVSDVLSNLRAKQIEFWYMASVEECKYTQDFGQIQSHIWCNIKLLVIKWNNMKKKEASEMVNIVTP